ncbi:DUF943 family protein [Erwinia pyrifoliae]|uniref:DUF943 family protein n=1 Tax=Erwinia pyrifoliae TaxID=79967 RepID=A0ABY5XBR1_ERWPY|nr:DUF943 family protein [Erwinia pyrifoliae]AUX74505.1 DUF943 domain-containing protein [Erwinia pyrifoliae]MCA8876685.1 DUF943 family protein [Erwinia pyrifoliae]MCT2386844.1 DUF943 family protein [Erwinia pyrifoliae]MCU8587557.1 DUF943 family protein [Erwinia pyrifoliae]UWS31403.1 DUF943 family protein [Erwinia pyrifoliae]
MSVILLLLIFAGYLIIRKQHISVVDAHYDGNTAQVIVDELPFLKSYKIEWWNENKESIMKKYNIPTGDKIPFLIVIYAFGDGYQVEDKEDRLCFSDIKPPKNCIDKKILMMIWRTRDGGVKYQF